MATISAAVNPVVVDWGGNGAPPAEKLLATDAETWKKGQLGYINSGVVSVVAGTGVTNAQFIMMEAQATATSTTSVWVQRLQAHTRLLMFVMTNGVAAAETAVTAGTSYGVEALSNISYLDSGTASGAFKVIRKGSAMNEFEMTAIMTPGIVLVEYDPATI